jgi:hypothetical protein
MRRTGRTSRIVSFAVEQLLTVGEVVVTDHIAFENRQNSWHQLGYFVTEVEKHFYGMCQPDQKISHERVYVGGINLFHFRTHRTKL